jgi:hypothetical protein
MSRPDYRGNKYILNGQFLRDYAHGALFHTVVIFILEAVET